MAFAIFDIETRIDKRLVKQAFFPDEPIGDEEAYQRFRRDLLERRGGDFFPTTLHVPISIAVGSVSDNHVLRSVESLALDNYSEERLCREFWERAERFTGCLVSFNGRQFDIPVLELQALRHGIPAPSHFAEPGGGRYRYSDLRHLDLYDFLTNFGAISLRGGLDLLLKLIGMPGKGEIDGSQVQELYEAGRMEEIHRYCRNDVVQTYFLFLRVELMRGRIDRTTYHTARTASAHFLGELRAEPPARKTA